MTGPTMIVLANIPVISAFLVPTSPFTHSNDRIRALGVQRCRNLQMTRQGVQEKMERAFLRANILPKDQYGYQVIEELSEHLPSDPQEGVEADEQDIFSPMELKAMYGEDYSGPFAQTDIQAGISDFSLPLFQKGDIIKGIVLEYDQGGALVDVGSKAPAILPAREISLNPNAKLQDTVRPDEEVEFQVISDQDDDGPIMLSLRRIQYEKTWESLIKLQASDKVFHGVVAGVNKGGALVMVEGLRAFLPGSHLSALYADDALVGQTLPLKFLELSKETGKLVVSHRRALVESQMNTMSRGDVVTGMVKLLKPYGAFVEVNGMSGLLHISQVSFDRVEDLSMVVQPGQRIKCMIVDHDKVNGRIALSTKTLEPSPGDMLKDKQRVFDLAEQTAKKYHERMEAERKAREEAAKDIVRGLSDGLSGLDDGFDADPLAGLDAFKIDPLSGGGMEPLYPDGPRSPMS